MNRLKRWILVFFGLVVVLFLLIQLVPYGRDHTNPPVVSEPAWDSAQTEQLARSACYDCHSNETVWPWYSNVAPVSWLLQRDVEEGREHLNFSDWESGHHAEEGHDADEMVETIHEGEMPPPSYLLLHSEANLTAAEKERLAQGLATLVETLGPSGIEADHDDEHEEEDN
jgi:hypothetical protein